MELVKSHWNLDGLEKAYRHGFMAGMVGKTSDTCPYKPEVITNAWEAGWQDGREQFINKQALQQRENL